MSPLSPGDPPALAAAVEEALGRLAAMDLQGALEILTATFTRMESAGRDVLVVPNPTLAREMEPWIEEYRFWVRLGLVTTEACRLLLAASAARGPLRRLRLYLRIETQLERMRRGLRHSIDLRTAVCGQAVARLTREVYRQLRGVLSQQAPAGPIVRPLVRLYRGAGARLDPKL